MRLTSRVRRPILGAIALLAGLVPPVADARQSEPDVTIENIRVGLAEDRDDQVFKVGTWTPVRVDLRAGAEPFEGVLRLAVPDDGGVPTFVRSRVSIPANETKPFLVYARPGDSTVSFRVEVLDDRGRRRAGASNDSALWLEPDQLVLASIGNPGGLELLPGMPEFLTGDATQASRLHVSRLRVPEGIPDRWYGYDAAEALVLDLNAQGTLEALQDFRSEPLKQWVRNGGHLVLAGGFPRWEQASSPDAVLRDLLPALPVGRTETGDLGAIESYVGSNTLITTPERPVSVTTFGPIPGRGGRVLLDDRSVGGPVIVRGPYGFGRVTMIGLSVDESPFVDWPDRKAFWASALDLGGRETSALDAPTSGAFASYDVIDLSSYLHRALEQFEGVRLVPFGWVAAFVFLYILLIGPGDYFFLKRVLGRMELTWITFPTIVVVVSLVAYATAYKVKGTDLRINRLDVVDVDQGFGDGDRHLARGTSFATIFSPQNRDYDVTVLPLPIEADDPGAAPPAPAEQVDEVITTWFGIAERRFGGMGNSGGVALTSSGYAYQSPGDPMSSAPPSVLAGVRVPIWTTKALMGSWSDDAPPAVEADLRDPGANRLEGTLTNRLGRPMEGVVIAYGNDVYQVDRPIAPGETIRVDSVPNRNLSGFLEDTGRSLNGIYASARGAGIPRAELVRALSFARAGRRRGQTPNLVLGDLDLSPQLDLGRPILIATLKGPSSALLLDGAEPDAREDRGTVLRVLLPAPSGD
ncbi:hypothetical protein [Tautonia plasticadhaerens]|uniref:Glutamine amidotransferase domain-containing protein n=1 Tax=Tautonia plasticadhaerens TaxID=2527974 RepID=A0A518GUQ6_9BACT|nr:hypothetical protein [Tautonia plasticadhaerens]QDV32316.1 hypothetical protein ElP_01440 [Tautonia plasticadhaerens]